MEEEEEEEGCEKGEKCTQVLRVQTLVLKSVQSPGNIPSMTVESCDCSSWTLPSPVTRMKNDSSPSFDSHTISAIRDQFMYALFKS